MRRRLPRFLSIGVISTALVSGCGVHSRSVVKHAARASAFELVLGRDGFSDVRSRLGEAAPFECEEKSSCLCFRRPVAPHEVIVFISSVVAGSGTTLSGVRVTRESTDAFPCASLPPGAEPEVDGIQLTHPLVRLEELWGMAPEVGASKVTRDDSWEALRTTPDGSVELMTTFARREVRFDAARSMVSLAAYYLEVF